MLTFDKLITQQPYVAQVLTSALKQQHLSHAYLFSGHLITEQLACAKLLVKSLVCLRPKGIEPCLNCNNCRKIEDNNYRDLHIMQTDQLMLKKHDSTELQHFMMTAPVEGDYKCYIILEADKLNIHAANSLLKSIEEPTGKSLGILISQSPQKILPTILSRCQHVHFLAHDYEIMYNELVQEYSKMSLEHIKLVSLLTDDIEEARALLEQDNLEKQIQLVQQFSEKLLLDPLCILSTVDMLPEFKSKKEQIFMYTILLTYYQDMLYYKLEKPRILNYTINIDNVSLIKIVNILEKILCALADITSNVNSQLVMEKLIIEIQGDKL